LPGEVVEAPDGDADVRKRRGDGTRAVGALAVDHDHLARPAELAESAADVDLLVARQHDRRDLSEKARHIPLPSASPRAPTNSALPPPPARPAPSPRAWPDRRAARAARQPAPAGRSASPPPPPT